MSKRTSLKWFTLVEMLIVMVIIWILAVVLTESYITISKTALRIEQEKNLSEESLILTQIFQAISDEATINYEQYSNLSNSEWFVDTLYLTWEVWSWTSISYSGNCLDLDNNFSINSDWTISKDIQEFSDCSLILNQNGSITQLTMPWKVVVSKPLFKVIPYDSDENYFSKYDSELWSNPWFIMDSLHQPAFWVFIHLYSPLYQPTWTNKIDQPLQLFFNLNL
jgi:Tfp pilus assembly protein PilE